MNQGYINCTNRFSKDCHAGNFCTGFARLPSYYQNCVKYFYDLVKLKKEKTKITKMLIAFCKLSYCWFTFFCPATTKLHSYLYTNLK